MSQIRQIDDHEQLKNILRAAATVANPDELAFGVAQEPSKWLPSVAAWRARWLQQPYALAVMPPELYDTLVQEHLPMQVVARDERRVVVAKPPAP